ncbi:metallophosphoesterase family protein [Bacteroidales bacterium OttesenSCG-928-B11]|nr:metallophosphoesterase family protein [Bacteroidales bacterium OttesenSCG-928-C03]MDL2311856.1 metallophosphoesterase family protein [Bacteroidales bacterium OttesenSCG-928-B11]MDL2326522.1 metallophosphoesterase family protein [Bacteroidales bacterium OttesenSCG-928-A14]
MKIKKLFFLAFILAFTYVNAQNKIDPVLHFNTNNEFKILQITDIHYVYGRTTSDSAIQRMSYLLDIEQPDFVVFTGDIITSKKQQECWDIVLKPVIDRKIPWAVVLGNHDDEHNWSRREIISYLEKQPYSLTQMGPEELKGAGNYTIPLLTRAGKKSHILYFMDSNAYSTIAGINGYGWFGFDQIAWYRNMSEDFTKENGGNPYPALAFFHIPLNEFEMLFDTTKNYKVYGTRGEKECPGALNSGMFTAMQEKGDVMGVFVGHEHDNDYIGVLRGIALAYSRFSGCNNIYNHIGYGARVIILKENERTFDTWIRTSEGEVLYKVNYPADFK